MLLKSDQVFNLAEMRSSRLREAQDPQLSPWHTPVSGKDVQYSLLTKKLLTPFHTVLQRR